MRTLRQLLRQPLKTFSGILLVGLAVAVLCVSFSQTLAAEDTAAKLKQTFITVALPAGMDTIAEQEWADSLITERTDIFQSGTQHGLASAYIPALSQDNYTVHLDQYDIQTSNGDFEPEYPVYSGAMLEITIKSFERNENGYEEHYRVLGGTSGNYTVSTPVFPDANCYSVLVRGTIDRVLFLEEGFRDPTGYNISLYLRVTDEEAFNALNLTEGERYLVYSNTYLDLDWIYRSYMVSSGKIMFWEEGVEVPYWKNFNVTEKEVFDYQAYYEAQRTDPNADPNDFQRIEVYVKALLGDLYTGITGSEAYMFRTIEMILENKAELPQWVWETDEDGNVVSGTQVEEYTYTDENGEQVTMSLEEYAEKYSVPTIVPLEGTAEEFLESEAGQPWKQALEEIEVNSHAYPVIGVDDLHFYADFACGRADIAEGRHFTAEELASGAKVCILSKSLAEANGLSVGDTISAQFMNYDFANPYQDRISENQGYINPTAYSYFSQTMSLNEAEEYTIVGLYEQDEPWGSVDNNMYTFTPNTIFAPKNAISGSMDYSKRGMFQTYVLDGDYLRELQLLTVEAGYDGIFYYFDNGYTNLANSLKGYTQAAGEILPLGLLVYGVLMVLYLFLFPGRQGRDLTMMDSFGATCFQRVKHIVLSCVGVLIPGSVLGTAVGISLWQYVSDSLSTYMETGVEVILDTNRLWSVCAVQVGLVLVLAAVQGAVMSSRVNYMKRK